MIIGVLAMMTAFANRAAVTADPAPDSNVRVLVFSDPHVLAPALFDVDSRAWQRCAERDMRVTEASAALLDSVVERALASRPDLVLVTGDLTKDGERASHEYVAEHLRPLIDAGIPTLVIPGNHDISNPYASAYRGDNALPVETVTRNDFAAIYADFGYGASSHRDNASLAYRYDPLPGLSVLALDSNRDRENLLMVRGDSVNTYHNAGTIPIETLDWLGREAAMARADGRDIIAICHHHVVPHCRHEATALPNYIVDNSDVLSLRLNDAGVATLFTGHLHISNLVSNGDIDELANGSLSTYPFAFSIVTIANGKIKSCETSLIGHNMSDDGRQRIERATPSLMAMVTARAWNLLDKRRDKVAAMTRMVAGHDVALPTSRNELNEIVTRYLDKPLRETVLAITEARLPGNDGEVRLAELDNVWRATLTTLLDEYFHNEAVTEFFLTNFYPLFLEEIRPLVIQ